MVRHEKHAVIKEQEVPDYTQENQETTTTIVKMTTLTRYDALGAIQADHGWTTMHKQGGNKVRTRLT